MFSLDDNYVKEQDELIEQLQQEILHLRERIQALEETTTEEESSTERQEPTSETSDTSDDSNELQEKYEALEEKFNNRELIISQLRETIDNLKSQIESGPKEPEPSEQDLIDQMIADTQGDSDADSEPDSAADEQSANLAYPIPEWAQDESLRQNLTKGSHELIMVVTQFNTSADAFTQLSPAEQADFIDYWINGLYKTIKTHDGIPYRFINGRFIGLFGISTDSATAGLNAVRFAWGLSELSESLISENPEWAMFIDWHTGIHKGEVVCNVLESSNVYDLIIIGSPLSLTSNLTNLAKRYDVHSILSNAVYDELIDYITAKTLATVHIKQFDQEITVYEPLGMKAT